MLTKIGVKQTIRARARTSTDIIFTCITLWGTVMQVAVNMVARDVGAMLF